MYNNIVIYGHSDSRVLRPKQHNAEEGSNKIDKSRILKKRAVENLIGGDAAEMNAHDAKREESD